MAVRSSLDMYAIDSTLFSFKDMTFVAEASDLTGHELYRQIYDDAADVGFAIRSTITGNTVRFFFAEEAKDADGDITKWTFKPIPEDVRKNPCFKNLKVVIFND